MSRSSGWFKAVALTIAAAMFVSCLPVGAARAGLVTTEQVLDQTAAAGERERLAAVFCATTCAARWRRSASIGTRRWRGSPASPIAEVRAGRRPDRRAAGRAELHRRRADHRGRGADRPRHPGPARGDRRLRVHQPRYVSLPRRVRGGRAARAAGALLLWALAGCATPESHRLLDAAGGLPPRAEVAGVPFFPQEEAYCGPAALATVLSWSGLPVTQDEVAAQVYTPGREGTLRTDVAAAARRHGRLAVPVTRLADLVAELAAGHPVLVFQNLGLGWFPVWHYAVAVGYDLEAGDTRAALGPRAAARHRPSPPSSAPGRAATIGRSWCCRPTSCRPRRTSWRCCAPHPASSRPAGCSAAAAAYAAIAAALARQPRRLDRARQYRLCQPGPRRGRGRVPQRDRAPPGGRRGLEQSRARARASRAGRRRRSPPRSAPCASAARMRRPTARPCARSAAPNQTGATHLRIDAGPRCARMPATGPECR